LTSCHAKVGGIKALTSRIFKLLEECNQIIWGFIPFIHLQVLKIKELNLMTEECRAVANPGPGGEIFFKGA